ncbi:MAG: GatB/YqeY domain-containing protein [Candidatus Omnitrophica bacterium]|nr:GatB/YqeY domain-containing protein [Candidatus Omnitrophota bacterium]MCK5394293.1 GatB/YqeY domain-containing protein [Candidatus Omnitrophota bacterium]
MLEKKIYSDYIDALKSKNKYKTNYLSFIRSELKNHAINLKKDGLDDSEVLIILKKLQKRLFDTKESISPNTRQDLLNDLDKELLILNQYLPKLLNNSELLEIIDEVILQTNASSIKDMGNVMKEVLSKVGLKADSKILSSLVKNKLISR